VLLVILQRIELVIKKYIFEFLGLGVRYNQSLNNQVQSHDNDLIRVGSILGSCVKTTDTHVKVQWFAYATRQLLGKISFYRLHLHICKWFLKAIQHQRHILER
jgi:uncharacterized Fe-S cluster-containing radical SAM superfamily protein